jgi:hypothetical protein
LVVAVALSSPTVALAHGGGTPRLIDVPVGPYRLYVWSSPEPLRVGDMHVTIAVVEAAQTSAKLDEPVVDANVRVLLKPLNEQNEPFARAATNQTTLLQRYYETDFSIPAAGIWQAVIEVSGPAGAGSASFDVEVLPPRRLNWQIALIITGALLIGIGLYGRRKQSTGRDSLRRR